MTRSALLAVVLALIGCARQSESSIEAVAGGPLRVVASVDELAAALSARRGQPLLVNLWAMWCTPCVAELPDLVEAGRAIRAAGGELIGLAMDLSAPGQTLEGVLGRMPTFLADRGVDYPVLVYGADDPNPVIQHFELANGALPITIAFDRDGRVVAVHDGIADAEELTELVLRAAGG